MEYPMHQRVFNQILQVSQLVIFTVIALSCTTQLPDDVALAYENLPKEMDFNMHIKPIISDRCFQCHGPDKNARKAGLRFDIQQGLFAKTESNKFVIKPGNINKSESIKRILSDDPEYMMPPPDAKIYLSAIEKAAIVKWVEQGAEWKEHWSFIPLEKIDPPSVDEVWKKSNAIDNFIYERLVREGLTPSPRANKEQLLRRVTMDLTGLPPTISEIDGFLDNNSPNAYERVVDRLLSSTEHAERLTLEWLDVARYSDSHGFHADGLRLMWPWRDWVIKAFNENMPYSEFVKQQLAGDLMPNATKDQILATAFNRNHPMTAEGGAIDEEFRIEYISNRTNTFGTAFLGLTIECAKCHDHKFDPISQKEYYQLSAFFGSVKELGMTGDDGNYGPLLMLTDDLIDEKISVFDSKISALEKVESIEAGKITAIIDFMESGSFEKVRPIAYHGFEKITKTDSSTYIDKRPWTKTAGEIELEKGVVGNAASFDNQYDKILMNKFGHFEMTDPFSVSVWVNPEEKTDKSMVIMGNSGSKNTMWRGWELYLDSANNVCIRLISSLPNNYIHVQTRKPIPVKKWTNIILTYDGSANASGLHLYINGSKPNEETKYDKLYKSIRPWGMNRKLDPSRALTFGKSNRGFSGDNGVYKGLIDEVAFFDKEIIPEQISNVYEQSGKGTLDFIYNPIKKQKISDELTNLRHEKLAMIDTITEVMVMEETPQPRKTYILTRGEYDRRGEEVDMSTPEKIMGFSKDYPKNRLGLSHWLFDKRNPLTGRVAVNRYWQMIFGRGIVSTANDFGSQGALPSHPELLDWLSVYFMESGWDLRALIRVMVMSSTYQQSSKVSKSLMESDPENILMARGPSHRWQAEFIRDNALASSGILNKQVGGKSAKPYQPEGLWIELGNFSHFLLRFEQDHDDNQYRRSMYTFIRRSSPPPFMTLFDAPNREVCTITREMTNTPLQALVLLNDPQFLETSRALAYRLKTESGPLLRDQITTGFQLVLSRKPSDEEIEVMETLYNAELEEFKKDEKGVIEYLNIGDFELPIELHIPEMAALTVLSNTLFNMDEMYTKR